jgi:hypothetical protein
MADRLEGRSIDKRFSLENGFALLERAVQDARRHEPQECFSAPRFQTFSLFAPKTPNPDYLVGNRQLKIFSHPPSSLN